MKGVYYQEKKRGLLPLDYKWCTHCSILHDLDGNVIHVLKGKAKNNE